MTSRRSDISAVKAALMTQAVETPSWAYGNSGTRFKVFARPGVPRTPREKLDDAARVHAHTGVAPTVALHIPWDRVDDYGALAAYAQERGLRLGTINANVFQDDDYKLGSVCHPDAAVRRKALGHLMECVDIMDATGSRDLKLWFSDGTNYPGQDDIRARQDRLSEALDAVYERLGDDQRMLVEYKLFEPAFYTMDVPDWGTAYAQCLRLGEKAQVVVDTGHHAPGTNIEFIVAILLREESSAASTSTPASTRTTTSWPAPPTRSSCSGSCTRSSGAAGSHRTSPSCSTSATTSRRRSPRSSAR